MAVTMLTPTYLAIVCILPFKEDGNYDMNLLVVSLFKMFCATDIYIFKEINRQRHIQEREQQQHTQNIILITIRFRVAMYVFFWRRKVKEVQVLTSFKKFQYIFLSNNNSSKEINFIEVHPVAQLCCLNNFQYVSH